MGLRSTAPGRSWTSRFVADTAARAESTGSQPLQSDLRAVVRHMYSEEEETALFPPRTATIQSAPISRAVYPVAGLLSLSMNT